MAIVTLPVTVIDPRSETKIQQMIDLAFVAILLGANVKNNADGTVSYTIDNNDIDIATAQGVIAVGGEINDFPLHTQTENSGIVRSIGGVNRYEIDGPVSEMGDISNHKTDLQINEMLTNE